MRTYTIYKLINCENGKVYIGQTVQTNLKLRWQNGRGYKDCRYMASAIRKYGWDAFSHEILETGLSKDEADDKERYYIALYRSQNPKYGYNISDGGQANTTFSEEGWKNLKECYAREKGYWAKAVTAFDLDGNRVAEFVTVKEAAQFAGVVIGAMSRHCTQARGTCGGYIFRYSEDVKGKEKLDESEIYSPNEQRNCWTPVAQYDLDGNKLAEFKAISFAEKSTGIKTSDIANVLNGSQKTAHGFMWRYAEDAPDKIEPYKSNRGKSRRKNMKDFSRYDRETGKRLGTYYSIAGAAREFGVSYAAIANALKGKMPTAAGFIWKYGAEERI